MGLKLFAPPPPQDRVKLCAPPSPFKVRLCTVVLGLFGKSEIALSFIMDSDVLYVK